MQYCGQIEFGGHVLHVYNSLDEPLFQAVEVAKLIDFSIGKRLINPILKNIFKFNHHFIQNRQSIDVEHHWFYTPIAFV